MGDGAPGIERGAIDELHSHVFVVVVVNSHVEFFFQPYSRALDVMLDSCDAEAALSRVGTWIWTNG